MSARRAFGEAGASAGTFEQRLQVGEVGVQLRFAGQGLAPVLLPALSPVISPDSGPTDVEVELWDERTTGVAIPPPVWRLRDVVGRGDVRALSGGRIRAQVDISSTLVSLWDSELRRATVWARDAQQLAYWVRAEPLRSIMHWALAGPHRHLLHAAAVGDEHAGALLVGPAGSGKSTTALACLADGLGYVGDDYVVVETQPPARAVSLYATAKLDAPGARLLPQLRARRLAPDASRFVVDVAQTHPELMRRSAAVSVILLPRVTRGALALRPASAAEALRALAPSTILQHAEESATGMAVMSSLVQAVPAYHLELGGEIAAVPEAIHDLLEASN